MIVVGIIGILSAIAIPYWLKSVMQTNARACVNNLRILEDAKQQLALEQKKSKTDTFTIPDLTIYLRNPDTTTCPSTGDDYISTGGTIADNVECPNYDPSDPEFSTHLLGFQ